MKGLTWYYIMTCSNERDILPVQFSPYSFYVTMDVHDVQYVDEVEIGEIWHYFITISHLTAVRPRFTYLIILQDNLSL